MFQLYSHLSLGLTTVLSALVSVLRTTPAAHSVRSQDRPEPILADGNASVPAGNLWKIWAEAAGMLDVPDCDWRTLQLVERCLDTLSTELERELAATSESRAAADLLRLRSVLAWIRHHEYDALESELQRRLSTALLYALGPLDQLDRRQHGNWSAATQHADLGERHGVRTR